MVDVPTFAAVGEFRCSRFVIFPQAGACGRPAHYMSEPDECGFRRYFCADHKSAGHQEIAGEQVVRRVVVTVEVYFCGVDSGAVAAQVDAWRRLEQAVAAAGGVVNLHDVRSVVGRYTPPARQEAEQTTAGGGESRPLKH